MELDIKAGMEEVAAKTEEEIELDTAKKWASRACGSFQLSINATKLIAKLHWIIRAEDLMREGLEHASLIRDEGKTVHNLQQIMDKYREQAYDLARIPEELENE